MGFPPQSPDLSYTEHGLGHLKTEKANDLWHHKRLCGTLSNHAVITRVNRFCTNLWSPCSLSAKNYMNISSDAFTLQLYTCKLLTDVTIYNGRIVLHWKQVQNRSILTSGLRLLGPTVCLKRWWGWGFFHRWTEWKCNQADLQSTMCRFYLV